MQIQILGSPIFCSCSSKNEQQQYNKIIIIIRNTFSIEVSANSIKQFDLSLTNNYIFLHEQINSNYINSFAQICFELKFEVILAVQKNVNSQKIGLKFYNKQNESFEVYSSQIQLIQLWIHQLQKKINRKGFHENFKPLTKLGKGNFATVYEVERVEDGRKFAAKAFAKSYLFSQKNGRQSLINELKLLREIHHENLIHLESVYQSTNSIYIILNVIQGGQLYHRIINSHGKFKQEQIKQVMFGILKGLEYLQHKRIIHRDLKPQNIMLLNRHSLFPIIVDFGLGTFCDSKPYLFNKCGTPGYVAPEIINLSKNEKIIQPVCDVFSAGIIFHILLLSRPLFTGDNYDSVYQKNKMCQIQFIQQQYQQLSYFEKDLLMKLLEIDATKRINAGQALTHPYFLKKQIL